MLSPPHQHHIKCDGCGARTDDGDIRRVFALWNRRSDRAGLIAGLREALATADAHFAGFDTTGERLACRLIGYDIRTRIAALETEEGK
jgi:hypothetical protein